MHNYLSIKRFTLGVFIYVYAQTFIFNFKNNKAAERSRLTDKHTQSVLKVTTLY